MSGSVSGPCLRHAAAKAGLTLWVERSEARWSPPTCPPLHTKRSLESNTHFTFQSLPGSVLKLETSCQKEKCCQGPSYTSWLFGFCPSVHARAWRRAARFHCFSHNLLNIWNFLFFFGPRYICRSKRRE